MQTKPQIIAELENKYNIVFKQVDLEEIIKAEWGKTTKYSIDINGEIIGLQINEYPEIDFSFLKELKNITKLVLVANQITDISILKELKNITELYLSRNQITDISILKELKNITTLNLFNNQVTDISSLKELKNITTLNLSANQITDISSLKELKKITTLDLSANQITDISNLKELKNIKWLDLSSNQITDISILKELKNITTLFLSNNQITDISSLKELKNITRLYLQSNQITDISNLKELKNITTLDLSINQITDISILKELKDIVWLLLSNNQITDISSLKHLKQFILLDLSNNQITDISPIKDFLKKINFSYSFKNNPLKYPPYEIVELGKNAINEYFEQQEKFGLETVYEAKILIVGEPGAGKTSLMKKLIDENTEIPDHQQSSTLGISVSRGLKFSHPTLENTEITANVWDFGGQEIQYMLHQYFLSNDSLYIVVSDQRTETYHFDNWFLMIEMLGTASSRILVLMNHFKNAITLRSFARVQYKRDFPNLKIEDDEFDLSETADKWKDFKLKIAKNLSLLPVVGQQNIKIWNTIRKEIEKIKEPYISVNEFYKLANKIGLHKDNDIELMLGYFNKIGVVLYFAEDLQLAKTVFLDPNWITQALYSALSNRNLDAGKGSFKKSWIFEIWQNQGYKKHECNDLLNLMQKDKFDICYPLSSDNEQFMVPMILNTDMPENLYEADDILQLRYNYENFMPLGIIYRLIVRLYTYIYEKTVWQRGAVLVYENDTFATIINPFGKKDIQIRIYGTRKKEFRAVIKFELDTIVKQFPNTPQILIPCICDTCRKSNDPHFYSLEELEERRKIDVKEIGCRKKPFKNVNVVELINGIDFTNFRRLLLDEKFDEFFQIMKSKFANISYQTKKEKMLEADFQREFHIILSENGLNTETEHTTNQGRIDNLIRISENIYIFEIKIDSNSKKAINQIIEKEYSQKFEFSYKNIYILAVNFSTQKRNIESYEFKKIK